jgi:hypothetical protein
VAQGFEQMRAAVAASLVPRAVPSKADGCMRSGIQAGRPECASGDTSCAMAPAGDSHATMFRPALRQIAAQQGWRLETMTKAACPRLGLPFPRIGADDRSADRPRTPGSLPCCRLSTDHST